MSNVNSLQSWKKRSEMMGEYVAGKNRVNVMPLRTQYGATYRQPVSQGVTRVTEIADAEYKRQQAQHQGARSRAQSIVQNRQVSTPQTSTPQIGGTVLTQEQILANNINDIIKQMNTIMSQPGQLLSPSMSPYYNIYMEQYRKNAEAAEANAFARSVASTGGYGSSYATMAGQQAYRDTMEGFTELTPSLVQTKGQAMSDLMEQYQLAKGLKEELGTSEAATYRMADGTEVEISEGAKAAYESLVQSEDWEGWDGTQVETLKAQLRNKGYNESDIETVVKMLESERLAQLTDMQKTNLDVINEGLADVSKIYLTQFGYTAEEVEEMDEDEYAATAKEAWLGNAASMAARNEIYKPDFFRIVRDDMVKSVEEIVKEDDKYALRDIANLVIALDDYQIQGALSSDFKTEIMVEIAKKLRKTSQFKKLESSMPVKVGLAWAKDEESEMAVWDAAMAGNFSVKNEEQRKAIMDLLKIKV